MEKEIKKDKCTNEKTKQKSCRIHLLLSMGIIFFAIGQIISHTSLNDNEILRNLSAFSSGVGCGAILVGCFACYRDGLRFHSLNRNIKK